MKPQPLVVVSANDVPDLATVADERARAERDLIDEFKWKPREGLA